MVIFIIFTLQYNYSIINANRDIEAAKQKKWETTATGLPQISGSVGYLNNIDFTLQGVSGDAFNPAGNPDDISLFAFGTKQSMNSNLTLSQLLFDGSYIVALQASKTYLKYYENAKYEFRPAQKHFYSRSHKRLLAKKVQQIQINFF